MSNDELRHRLAEVLGLAQEQMAEIAAVRTKQAALTATGAAADGLVEVTVNAHGQLLNTVIDENYLNEYEFDELADHVTEAAQAAASEVTRLASDMMVPISERRGRFPSLSDFVDGAPDLRDLSNPLPPLASQPGTSHEEQGKQDNVFPTVRR